jgi:hypothetical protein
VYGMERNAAVIQLKKTLPYCDSLGERLAAAAEIYLRAFPDGAEPNQISEKVQS